MIRKFSAGGIVFKKEGEKILWLIRRPAPNPGFNGQLGWNFPRGLTDENESTQKAALREVREETGIDAKIIKKLPVLKIFFVDSKTNEKTMKFITFYVMEWESDLSEGFGWETAETRWVTAEEADKLLTFKNEGDLLKKAAEIVKKPIQEGLSL